MKQTIEWHKNCLYNSNQTRKRYQQEVDALLKRIESLKKQNDFSEYQIKCAEGAKKDSFDNNKYKINDMEKFGL